MKLFLLIFVLIVCVGISHCSSHIVGFRVSVPLIEKEREKNHALILWSEEKILRQLGGPLG